MNLVISGRVNEALRLEVTKATQPTRMRKVSARAYRFEDVLQDLESQATIGTLCDAARIDHAYVQPTSRFKDFRLLALDMDSTLINIECIDEIASFIGKKDEVAQITAAAMRGDIENFAESLEKRVNLLKGASVDVLRRVFDEKLNLSDGAKELILAARQAGAYVLLLSGGFTYFTDRLQSELAIDGAYANTLEILNGQLTGRVRKPILDAAGKASYLSMTMAKLRIDGSQILVIGDGANDIPMLSLAYHSVAFRAKPIVIQSANFSIKFGGLDTAIDFFT